MGRGRGWEGRSSQLTAPPQDTHHHHWREGNLPSSARCEVCRKTCGSSDVLAGLRCEWCGIQVGRGVLLSAGAHLYGVLSGWGSPLYRRESGLPLVGVARSRPRGSRQSCVGPAESRRADPVPSKGPGLKAVLPQAHSVCCATLAPECTFGRLRTMILPPACVRLLSRNFSKMHCFRVSELTAPEPGKRG